MTFLRDACIQSLIRLVVVMLEKGITQSNIDPFRATSTDGHVNLRTNQAKRGYMYNSTKEQGDS